MKNLVVVIISMILMSTISFDAFAASEADVSKVLAGMNISSSSYAVMSGSTSEMVINNHAERKMQPGAVAMLVTAMVVLDKMYNEEEFENSVVISEKVAARGDSYKQGDTIKVRDLMKDMLVGGKGQAAEALATYSATKRSVFIREMNSKCLELRIMDTEFTNPSGAYSTKQYSTAADCAVITQAALRYEVIKEYLSRKGGIMSTLGDPVYRSQFAGSDVKDDMQFIVILMDSYEGKAKEEAKKLIDYASTIATRDAVIDAGKLAGHVMVRGGEKVRVAAYTETKGFAYVPPEGSRELIETEIVLDKGLEAPLEKGAKVGEFRILVADELKGTVNLVTHEKIKKGWFPSKAYISNTASIVLGTILGLLLLLLLRIIYVKRKREKMKALRYRLKLRELALEQMAIDEDRRRRNWTYGGGYEKFAPRTSDIRKEALENAIEEDRKR